MNLKDNKPTWLISIKKEVSIGNLLLMVGMLGAVGAGVWQGGMIQATLTEGIKAEQELRVAQNMSVNARLDTVTKMIEQTNADVRELRSIVVARLGSLKQP